MRLCSTFFREGLASLVDLRRERRDPLRSRLEFPTELSTLSAKTLQLLIRRPGLVL